MTAILPTREVEKPWGRDVLPLPFVAPAGARIGEIWFEPPPALPQLLVKYLFTSEALSVQVHPSDAQLAGHGKEECWLVVDAEPGAKLGIGFNAPLDAAAMRAAAIDGSIEDLLTWHDVVPGDFFYIPANTVHAIGAGIGLIEVQQNSDITYRLYDYGRPRELHLDEGMAVAKGVPFSSALHQKLPDRGPVSLVEGPYFRLDRVDSKFTPEIAARYGSAPLLIIPRNGETRVDGEVVLPGGCALVGSLDDVTFGADALALIAQPCAL